MIHCSNKINTILNHKFAKRNSGKSGNVNLPSGMLGFSQDIEILCNLDTHQVYYFGGGVTPMKVLHIDDSPEICDLYTDMFTADGSEIQSVNDGKQGLELVLKNDYDLILIDIYMPKYSGMQFLRDLKVQRPSEMKKVVVVSMLEFTTSQTEELLKLGIHSIETKPSNLQQLEIIKKNMWLR